MGLEQRASQPASNQQDLICPKAEAVIGQDWIQGVEFYSKPFNSSFVTGKCSDDN